MLGNSLNIVIDLDQQVLSQITFTAFKKGIGFVLKVYGIHLHHVMC